MTTQVSQASSLEQSGHWLQALNSIRHEILAGCVSDAEIWHTVGRLHQRLANIPQARRAYAVALLLDAHRPRTFNNLAILELGRLNSDEAERWLLQGLACQHLSLEDEELLQATACDLRLFQLRPDLALAHVENQLARRESVMALANRAVCLQKLARLQEAVLAQERAIRLHLAQHASSLLDAALEDLVGQPCADLTSSNHLQTQLMNLALYRLSLDGQDSLGLRLLLAGTTFDQEYWQDPRPRQTCWDGSFCDQLILWDDQGFGDTIQNLGWISDAARRVDCLRIWLRPSLLPLVRACLPLPANCQLESLDPESSPWRQGAYQIGFFYLPIVLKRWLPQAASRGSYLELPLTFQSQSVQDELRVRRIGLVWSAGRHKSPQPERNARVRDVPRQAFFELAQIWRQRHQATLVSMQLEGHDEQPVQALIQTGVLEQPLHSADWLQTAEVLSSLDLLISVDTSVAHLAGALGVPTVLMLNAPADWRWGQVGHQTFLYDAMTVVRCSDPGDWSQVLQQVDRDVSNRFMHGSQAADRST